MNYRSVNELRRLFLEFFKKKGHVILKSYSLVPENDGSLLFINSGMAPLKDWFLGNSVPVNGRVVSCQKCIRTPDIDQVGKTSRHGTFFEMLGNFSFADYFKKEAIEFAWEFVKDVLQLPLDKLYITVYEEDDEAYNFWTKVEGLDSAHIFRLGKKDNFWEIGLGPCGPCSEIYFDRGCEFGCGKEGCCPGCECDRFVEFWNLVFSQYDNRGNGNYVPMKKPNIDTGMGLERLACITQGVDSLFEIDSVKKILLRICEMANISYGKIGEKDVLIRIVTDHVRSSVFLISDGVMPSNEGRGYVLRRLIRRAHVSGKKLGLFGAFLEDLSKVVIEEAADAYCELASDIEHIEKVLRAEEESFDRILENGERIFLELVEELENSGLNKIAAGDAFRLCDTHGFPFDLLKDLAVEKGFEIDEAGFLNLMEQQRKKARKASALKDSGWQKVNFRNLDVEATEFTGYRSIASDSTLLAIVLDGKEVETAACVGEGEELDLIFDRTPFYAVGGGQVSDSGEVCFLFGKAKVLGCERLKSGQYIHRCKLIEGKIAKNEKAKLFVNSKRRMAISRNHTAAHVLHKALLNVLGDHLRQAGQLVEADRLRFDFTHFAALTKDELSAIEKKVNEVIFSNVAVEIKEMAKEEAEKTGAIALFDEKYGKKVRVVKVGDFSAEFCGGTHVENSAEIGLFKIINESSVGFGVRRIEAKTGENVLAYVKSVEDVLNSACGFLKVGNIFEVGQKVRDLTLKFKASEDKVKALSFDLCKLKVLKSSTGRILSKSGFTVLTGNIKILDGKMFSKFGEEIKKENPSIVALIVSEFDEKKLKIMVVCGAQAVSKGVSAKKFIEKLGKKIGCRGGGRDDFAVAGIESFSQIKLVEEMFLNVAGSL